MWGCPCVACVGLFSTRALFNMGACRLSTLCSGHPSLDRGCADAETAVWSWGPRQRRGSGRPGGTCAVEAAPQHCWIFICLFKRSVQIHCLVCYRFNCKGKKSLSCQPGVFLV